VVATGYRARSTELRAQGEGAQSAERRAPAGRPSRSPEPEPRAQRPMHPESTEHSRAQSTDLGLGLGPVANNASSAVAKWSMWLTPVN
jgi:hypothetical protein